MKSKEQIQKELDYAQALVDVKNIVNNWHREVARNQWEDVQALAERLVTASTVIRDYATSKASRGNHNSYAHTDEFGYVEKDGV